MLKMQILGGRNSLHAAFGTIRFPRELKDRGCSGERATTGIWVLLKGLCAGKEGLTLGKLQAGLKR